MLAAGREADRALLAAGTAQFRGQAPLSAHPASATGARLTSPRRQAAALTAAGARVVLVRPDRAAVRAIGRNVLDVSRRAAAARAGRTQAAAEAPAVRAVWQA